MKHFVKFLIISSLFISFSPVLNALEVYKNSATASFYGKDFHGKKTSNGETFNMYAYTCANKELPFDTILKVTNLANGKSVEVRVNDRGPFVSGRTVDLSTQAAIDLGMIKTGLDNVKLEIVKMGPDTKLSRDTAASAKKIMLKIEAKSGGKTTSHENTSGTPKQVKLIKGKIYDIQLASFSSKENAQSFARKVRKDGFDKIVLQSNEKCVRVALAKIPASDVPNLSKRRDAKGYSYLIKERKEN